MRRVDELMLGMRAIIGVVRGKAGRPRTGTSYGAKDLEAGS